ncbi:transcriptional regulator [Streptomyces decoyicus]|uniref:transcriptional regulator n=1 Tax=Streptomyces decoyicus TaxID=249567 RepID=UPI00386CB627
MLATRLSAMLPGVATVRVTLRDPRMGWPRIDASAHDEHGKRVRVSHAQSQVAARWIIRAHPEAGWQQSRAFNLRTAELDADGGR